METLQGNKIITETTNQLLTMAESFQNRYIENEEFLLAYVTLPWWKRILFGRRIILNHINDVLDKYKDFADVKDHNTQQQNITDGK